MQWNRVFILSFVLKKLDCFLELGWTVVTNKFKSLHLQVQVQAERSAKLYLKVCLSLILINGIPYFQSSKCSVNLHISFTIYYDEYRSYIKYLYTYLVHHYFKFERFMPISSRVMLKLSD